MERFSFWNLPDVWFCERHRILVAKIDVMWIESYNWLKRLKPRMQLYTVIRNVHGSLQRHQIILWRLYHWLPSSTCSCHWETVRGASGQRDTKWAHRERRLFFKRKMNAETIQTARDTTSQAHWSWPNYIAFVWIQIKHARFITASFHGSRCNEPEQSWERYDFPYSGLSEIQSMAIDWCPDGFKAARKESKTLEVLHSASRWTSTISMSRV